MKKILLSLLALVTFLNVKADEGMWIPMLIGKNIEEMQRMGLKLSADDIYNVNNASLKDAVVHFGGGCTGEMISPNGLLITNHHCGYGNIASLSSVEHNYLEDGFWSKKMSEELPAKGLSVKFLVRMEDVTAELNKALSKKNDKKAQKSFDKEKEELEKKASENGKYVAVVSEFYNGNQYILIIYQVFNDVRFVAAPPRSLGKYGGDTDNWVWPRHTADFSMFRVYANSKNEPADYSPSNVPYHPKKYLPISIKDLKENEFSMVMGYPGRTNRYETSYGVELAINETNPAIVKIRDMKLAIMRKAMRKDPAVNLKLASSYASIANYWKYYIGQTEQLKRLKVVAEKQNQEKDFSAWAQKNDEQDKDLMSQFNKIYATYRPYATHSVYYREAFAGSALAKLAANTKSIYDLLSEKRVNQTEVYAAVEKLKKVRNNILENFVPEVEQEIFAKTSEIYYNDVPKSQLPDIYQKLIFKQFSKDSLPATFENFAQYTFKNTFLLNNDAFNRFCAQPSLATLNADPAVQYALSFVNNFNEFYLPKQIDFYNEKEKLSKAYIAGLMKKNEGELFYPDANSTMRVSYGKVAGYNPRDGVHYDYETTLNGLLAKYIPGDYEFDLPKDFLKLAKEKDFGRYGNSNGDLITCFITNNDITGGNSGSPVIDAYGALLGLAFDGNWEAMSGDIAFDKKYKRTICVDIRFVLWLIDKYGGAKNLINEMTIIE